MQDIITTSYDSLPDGSLVLSVKLNEEIVRTEPIAVRGARSEAFCLDMVLSSLSPGRNLTVVCMSGELFREMTDSTCITDDIYIEAMCKAAKRHNIRWLLKT
jgi:hypothetical protein